MISKITSTPLTSFSSFNSIFPSQKANDRLKSFNFGLEKDTVSFSGKTSEQIISDVVNKAFDKLNKSNYKTKNKFKMFASTVGDVNLFIQETVLGKEARFTLSNGNFNGQSFVNFDLRRSLNSPSEISSYDLKISSLDAAKLINNYLK